MCTRQYAMNLFWLSLVCLGVSRASAAPVPTSILNLKVESMSVPESIHQYLRMFGSETAPVPSIEDEPTPLMPRVVTSQAVSSVLKFAVRPQGVPSRRQEGPSPEHEQFSLF